MRLPPMEVTFDRPVADNRRRFRPSVAADIAGFTPGIGSVAGPCFECGVGLESLNAWF